MHMKEMAEAIPFWPFIFESNELKNSSKLKVDWDKWQDEDEQNG